MILILATWAVAVRRTKRVNRKTTLTSTRQLHRSKRSPSQVHLKTAVAIWWTSLADPACLNRTTRHKTAMQAWTFSAALRRVFRVEPLDKVKGCLIQISLICSTSRVVRAVIPGPKWDNKRLWTRALQSIRLLQVPTNPQIVRSNKTQISLNSSQTPCFKLGWLQTRNNFTACNCSNNNNSKCITHKWTNSNRWTWAAPLLLSNNNSIHKLKVMVEWIRIWVLRRWDNSKTIHLVVAMEACPNPNNSNSSSNLALLVIVLLLTSDHCYHPTNNNINPSQSNNKSVPNP